MRILDARNQGFPYEFHRNYFDSTGNEVDLIVPGEEISVDFSDGVYLSSLVSLTGESGKAWESLYIPTDLYGTDGISITWWSKTRSGKPAGSVQIKRTNETEYYNKVGSKVNYGTYSPEFYMGRAIPINSGRHDFVRELSETSNSLPPLGFPKQELPTLKSEVASLLMKNPPIRQFIQNIAARGLGEKLLTQIVNIPEDYRGEIGAELIKITAEVGSEDAFVRAKPKKAEIEETYSMWGAFG